MEIYIGVDWSRNSAICHIGSQQKSQRCEVFPHPRELDALLVKARKLVPEPSTIRVLLEAGSNLWLRLFCQTDALVYVVDGKQSKRFVESMSPGGAKDDNRDAHSMFKMSMSPEHRGKPYELLSDELRSLEKLSSIHERWTSAKTAEVQRLRQQLAETLPSISLALPKIGKKFALAFMEKFPTPKEICKISKRSFDSFVKKHRLRKPTKEKLWSAVQESFILLEPEETKMHAMLVRQLVERIRSLNKSLLQVEEQIEQLYQHNEAFPVLDSIKGIGRSIGSLLVSQVFTNPEQKRDQASIRTGASPLTFQSGKKRAKKGKKQEQKKQVRMRKSVPSRLRRMTYLLGLQITRWHDWAKAQYNAMRARGKSAACAFRAVSRSMLRIIRALLRDGKEYDRDLYVRGLQAKGVIWAMSLPVGE